MISIIIPVYNSEQVLKDCILSILKQEYNDIEVILVDDGSKDNSGTICDTLSRTDNRIRVIHKENGGISSARNSGIEIATGEWVIFCDNDDFVSKYWLKRLLEIVENGKYVLPLSAFTRKKEEFGKEKRIVRIEPKLSYSISEFLLFYENQLAGFVWNSLYRRDIIEKWHIRFPERHEIGDINEDLIFQLKYLPHVQGIVYTGFNDYLWTQNETNHSNKTTEKWYFEKYEEKYRLLRSWITSLPPEVNNQMKRMATMMLYHFIYAICNERDFNRFRMYIKNPSFQECIHLADCSNESSKVIYLLRKKYTILLWLLLRIAR
jgi:glycosyltransferase involved in cell wall biosynthesis